MAEFPHRQTLMQASLEALQKLGGSASKEELVQEVIALLKLPDEIVEQKHKTRSATYNRTHLDYELAWSWTYLKQLGFLENSIRGIWALTAKGKTGTLKNLGEATERETEAEMNASSWEETLLRFLIDRLSPKAFERLIQRVLRETGFSQVEITGNTNDGGIDGRGIATINGMLSFRVVFQCKRHKGGVGAPVVRDFRGAMQGRADKGLLITTGHFTREAIKESNRDGAIAIDLYDGSKLVAKLKTLGLGVKVTQVEHVEIDEGWFDTL
ncbi:restriction endonuclease [Roseimicrobium gellanilyticum]|nr:restriction endonuclease [Roseimicrobium gellanilyticum]